MKIWNTAPLLRLLLPFITGITTAIYIALTNILFSILTAAFFLTLFIFSFRFKSILSYRISWLYGIALTCLFFLLGYQLTILKTELFSVTHFSNRLEKSSCVYVRVASAVVEKEKSVKAVVEVLALENGDTIIPVKGKSIIYFQKEERALCLNNGDELILKNKFKKIDSIKNPEEFDYRRFLFYKNIYHQAYLKKSDWTSTGKNSGNILVNAALRLRNKLLSVFQDAGLKGDEYAVAAALLIGYTDKLDPDLLSAYSETGVLHILSVSGMHVAIVFVVFNYILFFLDKLKYGKLLKTLLLIFFLWFYAFLSGLSPSVLRAATMFSFIVCARAFKRNTNIYNTLAASALFLLLWNPYLIMDVGFQLSYLAVAGIVYLQPFLSNLLPDENWLSHQLNGLVSVSIAAQLATLPVSLYYFHQFPNYFLFSNMVIIPLSTCIIYLGMLLIAVSPNAFLLKYITIVFSKAVLALNDLVVYFSNLPFALAEGIYIRIPEMCLLYALIIFLHLFFLKKKFVFLNYSLLFILSLLIFQLIKQATRANQKKMIVYAVPGISAIDLIAAKEHVLLMDTASIVNKKSWMQHLKLNWCKMGLEAPLYGNAGLNVPFARIRNDAIQFYDKRIVILNRDEKTKLRYLQKKLFPVDYVIVSKNGALTMLQVKEVYKPACIIFDMSNTLNQIKTWEKECAKIHQACYSVADSGAFRIDI